MNDLRLGDRVEVLHATFEGEDEQRVQSGREWRPGVVVGLYLTSIHVRLDDEQTVFALSANDRDLNWKVKEKP